MKKLEVFSYLNQIREAREARSKAVQDLSIAISEMMRLLIHEGLAQYMSPEQIAAESGHPVKYVRDLMRTMDLNPKSGRTVLSRKAAEALNTNAALMGIDPSDFDLTSPLAYLPMGSVLKRQLTEARTSQVDEAEVSGNALTDRLKTLIAELRSEHSVPMSDADTTYWERYEEINAVLDRVENLL